MVQVVEQQWHHHGSFKAYRVSSLSVPYQGTIRDSGREKLE